MIRRREGTVESAYRMDDFGSSEAKNRVGKAHRDSAPQGHKTEPRRPLAQGSCRGHGGGSRRAVVSWMVFEYLFGDLVILIKLVSVDLTTIARD